MTKFLDAPRGVIMAICDNPLLTTGFANVARPILKGFAEAGYAVYCLGMMGGPEDIRRELPYALFPAKDMRGMPDMGFDRIQQMLLTIKPDVVWMLADPGNLGNLLYFQDCVLGVLKGIENGEYNHVKGIKPFKIVAYAPVEGRPINQHFADIFQEIENHGAMVFYTKLAAESMKKLWPECPTRYIHHGIATNVFQPLTPEDKQLVKDAIGVGDRFLVGCFGANKRTKGFPELFKAIKHLDGMDPDCNIIFYLHTDHIFVMDGPPLHDLAKDMGILHRIVFKPGLNMNDKNNPWHGTDMANNALETIRNTGLPLPEGYTKESEVVNGVVMDVLAVLDYRTRLGMLDLLVDPSQVEGWGLIPWEAMAMKVPVLGVKDHWVRDELLCKYRYAIEPTHPDLWDTWNTGAPLVRFDPLHMANYILGLSRSEKALNKNVDAAYDMVQQFSWDKPVKQWVQLIEEVTNGVP